MIFHKAAIIVSTQWLCRNVLEVFLIFFSDDTNSVWGTPTVKF